MSNSVPRCARSDVWGRARGVDKLSSITEDRAPSIREVEVAIVMMLSQLGSDPLVNRCGACWSR